jgi:hypothetical protein
VIFVLFFTLTEANPCHRSDNPCHLPEREFVYKNGDYWDKKAIDDGTKAKEN